MALPAGEAFLLFSAQGERRWVAGWTPHYVHPVNPCVQEGVVFQTLKPDVGTATWVQTRHDPASGCASFVYFVPDHHVAQVDVGVTPIGTQRSRACVTYHMTSLSLHADDFVLAFAETFEAFMADWATAIQRHIVEGVPLDGV